MKTLWFLLAAIGIGVVAFVLLRPSGTNGCEKLASLCTELDVGRCSAMLGDSAAKFDTCMANVSSCPGAASCLVGAGLHSLVKSHK